MNAENTACPTDPLLADFGLGKLDAASSDTISQHLETCADCRQRVAGLSGDSFVDRLRGARPNGPQHRDRTYVPGESLTGAGGSTDGSSVKEDGLPRPSRKVVGTGGQDGLGRPPHEKDGLGSPSSNSAPPELTNHPDYELLKELGRGGMGVVYLARNRMMDRLEVLKVVNKALLDRPEALERFQQEIRSAARLSHPNIVAAYSVLRPGDLLVFAMEYVRGQDLSQVVKARGQLPVAHAAFYAHQVTLGLQHAHERGMVHRDIKPNNLMLAVEGKKHIVKILDFGLSKATSEKGAEAGLTKSGQILGTPDYVAPEQTLNAQKADIRADIYSLGCTLYHLLSGGPPFQETSLYGILEAHQKRDPRPLNLVRPDVPVELAAVVAKMMAKDPAKRYQTPAEVARALAPFFKPGQTGATTDVAPASQSPGGLRRGTGYSRSGSAAGRLAMLPPSSPVAPSIPQHRPLPVATPIPVPAPASVPEIAPVVAIDTGVPRRAAFHQHRWWSWWSMLPPWRQRVAVAGASAFLLLLAGIVFFMQTKDGLIRFEIDDPQIEVAIKGTEIVLKQADNGHDVKLSAGEKTLVVERGDFKFETDKLILKKGETVTVAVTLSAGQVKVKQGDKLLGQAKLPAVWHGWPADAPAPAIAPFDAAAAKKYQAAWAKYLKLEIEHTNSVGMKFILIPPGEFTMGSTPAEIEETLKFHVGDEHWQERNKSEAPQHKVILTQPFYLGTHEVTQAEYKKVMEKNPSHFAPMGAGKDAVAEMDTTTFPVETVSWNDAAEFCAKLSEKEKLKPYYFRSGETVTMLAAGTGYHLPTEAQWEFACRAGTTTKYWIGDQDEDLLQAAWFQANSGSRMHQVGELKANPFGLYDIHGNVWEWVQDGWEPAYYAQFQEKPALDPSGPSSAGSQRVLRGGRCYLDASNCRSSSRHAFVPTVRHHHWGFRVVLPFDAVKSALSKQPSKVNTGWNDWPADAPKSAIAPFDAKQALAHQEAWAKHLGTKVEVENSLGMKLRLIPPGEFKMGSPPSEADRRGDELQHRVRITKPFFLGVCEVTQREYQNVMGNNPSHYSPGGAGKDQARGLDTHQFPVENVSWDDAVEFCRKLSALAAEQTAGHVYRLPTEAEWEYACRAGTTTPFHVGDKLNGQQANYDGQHPFATNGGGPFLGRPTEVGSYAPNPFGLRDMHGNVAECCFDWHAAYGEPVGGAVDPVGAGTGSTRVTRGGGWVNGAAYCRTASRESPQPTVRLHHLGFRVALVPSGQASDAASVGRAGPKETPASPPPAGAASVSAPEVANAPFDAKQALAHQEAWAKHLGTKVEIENSVGMKLRLIPPGEFTMGSPYDDGDAEDDEKPQVEVALTQPLYVSKTEVTQGQWQAVMNTTPWNGQEYVKEGAECAASYVTWDDARVFCKKLGEKEGMNYRLLTEAEWEYACRAGTTTKYHLGDDETELGSYAWFVENAWNIGETYAHEVAKKQPNPFGLYDMHGNVWEWCHDVYGGKLPGGENPSIDIGGSARVFRGGGCYYVAAFCRSAFRRRVQPTFRANGLGFRVARSSVQGSEEVSQGGRE